MLLHYKTIPANLAGGHGNYIGVTEDLKVIPLVYDAGEGEFYLATDADFDAPVSTAGLEVAYLDNSDAIFTNAEIADTEANTLGEPEDLGEEATTGDGECVGEALSPPVPDYEDAESEGSVLPDEEKA